MRYDQRTQRLRLRLKLQENGVPKIDKKMLRGGLKNINLRKEIRRYGTETKKFEDKEILVKPVLKDIRFMDWSSF